MHQKVSYIKQVDCALLKLGLENPLNIHNCFSIHFCDFPLIARWKKSRHYQFDWVCAAHLEYRSLVLKNAGVIMQHVLVALQYEK